MKVVINEFLVELDDYVAVNRSGNRIIFLDETNFMHAIEFLNEEQAISIYDTLLKIIKENCAKH